MERVDPDKVWGKEFRVPSIKGLGSGRGFDFANLHLPRDWGKAIPYLRTIKPTYFQQELDLYSDRLGFLPGDIRFEPESGVLTEIIFGTTPLSRLYLDRNFPFEEEGRYRAEKMTNLRAAIVALKITSKHLNLIGEQIGLPYTHAYIEADMDGSLGDYFSYGLDIPSCVNEFTKELTYPSFVDSFKLEVSNIMGRFGLTLGTMRFNEEGLASCNILEQRDCDYTVRDGSVVSHNTDNAYQAAVLHGVWSNYLNHIHDLISQKKASKEVV